MNEGGALTCGFPNDRIVRNNRNMASRAVFFTRNTTRNTRARTPNPPRAGTTA